MSQSFLQYLLGNGVPLNEAQQYLFLSPSYSDGRGEEGYAKLASTIYANHLSNEAKDVAFGQRRDTLPSNLFIAPRSTEPPGVVPYSFDPTLVTKGPVVSAGLLGNIPVPSATTKPVQSNQVTNFNQNAAVPTQTAPNGVVPTTTAPRALPPAPAPISWPTPQSVTPPIVRNQPASAGQLNGYSAPWNLGGNWAGVKSQPMYGAGLLGSATGQASNVDRAKNAFDDNNGDGSGYGGGTTAPSTSVNIGGTGASSQGKFVLPGTPAYNGQEYAQTYNGQPAPYASLHQQIYDAMRGVQPLVPTFNWANQVQEQGAQGLPKANGLLGGGNYFPGMKK